MRFMVKFTGVVAAALVALTTVAPLSAQQAQTGSVSGRVTGKDGVALAGARVVVTNLATGSEYGAATQADGSYRITDLRPGSYRVMARRIGYDVAVQEIRLAAGESREVSFALGTVAIALNAIEVFSTHAVEQKTPVPYTDVEKVQIEQQLGSRDIPLVLNTTPSVYASEAGGAAGDARINVRGFDQRNVAVMINGVPVNDMENGWVYWSNWDGVGDATSTIQLQRGLSAVNLATPSIGGTLNIITDATSLSRGGMLKQEVGTDGFLKTTAMLASGLVGDKFAFMAQGVRKTGDGLATGIWTDAWAYYVGASYNINDNNRLDLYALGAPQRHGQRLYAQNIAAHSAEFARSLEGFDPGAIDRYTESRDGFRYNQNWNTVSTSYTGKQAVGGRLIDRHDPNFLNERENFFHKPQINLNWFSALTPTLSLSTVAYFSGGRGGGTGEIDYFSGFTWDYSGPSRIPDWNAMVAVNRGTVDRRGDAKEAGRSMGILRNSRNNQWTVGAISKLSKQFSSALTVEVGADWRTAEIDHYREVRDLLGGRYFIPEPGDASDFWASSDMFRFLGEKIDYDFTNTVDWLGGYLQAEHSTDEFTLFGMGGLSTIKYTYTNHFRDDGTGNPLYSESDNIVGYQLKGGALYNVTDEVGIYLNGGYISKVPIFDGVIDDVGGIINPDPKNETFLSFEAGLNYRSLNRAWAFDLNAYFTRWNDRTLVRSVVTSTGEDALINLLGLDAQHIGIEAQAAFRPIDQIRFDVSGSVSNWTYTDDVEGTYRDESRSAVVPYTFYVRDLKVGDAPQTQLSVAASVFPVDGAFVQVVGSWFGRHWAAFDPFDRTDATDRVQSWRIPNFEVLDAHVSYTLPRQLRLGDTKIFLHVFNLLDDEYITDAVDNSSFNGFDDDHDADDAEVFFGLRRRFNAGVQVRF